MQVYFKYFLELTSSVSRKKQYSSFWLPSCSWSTTESLSFVFVFIWNWYQWALVKTLVLHFQRCKWFLCVITEHFHQATVTCLWPKVSFPATERHRKIQALWPVLRYCVDLWQKGKKKRAWEKLIINNETIKFWSFSSRVKKYSWFSWNFTQHCLDLTLSRFRGINRKQPNCQEWTYSELPTHGFGVMPRLSLVDMPSTWDVTDELCLAL